MVQSVSFCVSAYPHTLRLAIDSRSKFFHMPISCKNGIIMSNPIDHSVMQMHTLQCRAPKRAQLRGCYNKLPSLLQCCYHCKSHTCHVSTHTCPPRRNAAVTSSQFCCHLTPHTCHVADVTSSRFCYHLTPHTCHVSTHTCRLSPATYFLRFPCFYRRSPAICRSSLVLLASILLSLHTSHLPAVLLSALRC